MTSYLSIIYGDKIRYIGKCAKRTIMFSIIFLQHMNESNGDFPFNRGLSDPFDIGKNVAKAKSLRQWCYDENFFLA